MIPRLTAFFAVSGALALGLWACDGGSLESDTTGPQTGNFKADSLREWKEFRQGAGEGKAARKRVEQSDFRKIREMSINDEGSGTTVISYELSGMWIDQREYNGIVYETLDIPGAGNIEKEGAPELPQEGLFVAIPENADLTDATFSVADEETIVRQNDVRPVSKPVRGDEAPEYIPDSKIYGSDDPYPPGMPGRLIGTKYVSGRKVAHIMLYPVQYKPLSKTLVVLKSIKITVGYHKAAGTDRIARRSILQDSPTDRLILDSATQLETERERIRQEDFASCVPDCSGIVCGLDPKCGKPCGTDCAEGVCLYGQCVAEDSGWVFSAGGTKEDNSQAIAMDASGNALIAGYFSNQATFGSITLTSNGKKDSFVAKVSASGEVLWAFNAGGTGDDYGFGVAMDGSGNAFVTGSFVGQATFGSTTLTSNGPSDIFVLKVSPSGEVLRAINVGGMDPVSPFPFSYDGNGIAVDGGGNALVTGHYKGQATFGNITLTSQGESDIFVAKVSTSGDILWAVSAGGANKDFGSGITVDTNGNSLITGNFRGQATFGSTTLTSQGKYSADDVFVAKLSTSGEVLWAISGGGDSSDMGYGIAADGSGNALVTGHFEKQATFGNVTISGKSSDDIFIVKVSPSGEVLWALSMASVNDDSGIAVTTDANGNAWVTGYFSGPAAFGSTTLYSRGDDDAFLVKVSPSGDILRAVNVGQSISSRARARGQGIALDGNGDALITGNFWEQVNFGNTTLSSPKGDYNLFAAKVSLSCWPDPGN